MVPELIALVPERLHRCPPELALTAVGAGVALWAVGGVFSRYMTTLVAVAVGTFIGLRAPGWLGWQIDGMGTGVAGALLLGTSGYLLHRTWIGLWLAGLLSAWCGVGVWIQLGDGSVLPAFHWRGALGASFTDLWHHLPPNLHPQLPLGCAVGATAGVLMSVLWPKFSRCFTYSLIGTTLTILMGVVAAGNQNPSWLTSVHPSPMVELAALLIFVLLGIVVQWRLMPESPRVTDAGAKPARKRSEHVLEDSTTPARMANA